MSNLQSVSLRLSPAVADKLHDLARRSSKTSVLTRAIVKYKDANIAQEPAKPTSFKFPVDTLETLNEIMLRSGVTSRNQAIALIIERAWEDAQSKTNA
jgi:predicted DNA-binding protein